MNEMIERVAKALEAHARETYRGTDVMTMLPPDWEPWIGPARAAIAAMRKPTPAMLIQGSGGGERYDWLWDAWETMIDEALK